MVHFSSKLNKCMYITIHPSSVRLFMHYLTWKAAVLFFPTKLFENSRTKDSKYFCIQLNKKRGHSCTEWMSTSCQCGGVRGGHVLGLTLSGPLRSQPHLPSTCNLPQCWRQLSSPSGNFHVDSLYSSDGRFLLFVVTRFAHGGETALLRLAWVMYSHIRFHIVSCGL